MTIVCPLCTNLNEMLAQPSSISWKQVACSSCEANLVLVRETASKAPRRSLSSTIRLMPPLSGSRPGSAVVRPRLLIIVASALALGVLGYFFWEAEFFDNDVPIESTVSPSTGSPPASPRQSPIVSQPLPVKN